jgi:methionyl-tRNA formyltransferase
VYLGTPEVAVPPLVALRQAGHDVALVVTRPDARRARRGHDTPSPVKAAARELGLSVSHDVDDALGVGADLGVVVAYGRIIPVRVLERLPMVNIHFSLLPRWRGAAPVERAILAGDAQTGVCLMAVEEGLDTGDVYSRRVLDIGPHESADELRGRLVDAAVDVLLDALENGIGPPEPQVGEATYAQKIDPAELELDWSRPATELERVVGVGGAWTTWRGHRLKVWRATAEPAARGLEAGQLAGDRVGTGDGALRLVEVQPEGKARHEATAWIRGARPASTDRLGRAE